MKKIVLLILVAALASCGVKSDLVKPDGKPAAEHERDPSRPTNQRSR